MPKALVSLNPYICKLILVGHAHIHLRIHKNLQELLLRHRRFLELLQRAGDVSEVFGILRVDLMVDEKRDECGFFDGCLLALVDLMRREVPLMELKS